MHSRREPARPAALSGFAMIETLLIVLIVLVAAVLVLQALLWRRGGAGGGDAAALTSVTDGVASARTELDGVRAALAAAIDRTERTVRDEAKQQRDETTKSARELREEVGAAVARLGGTLGDRVADLTKVQQTRFDSFATALAKLTETNELKLDALRAAVEQKLTQLQQDNATKLEEMRKTVDEKLQGTLEARLSASFKLVSERLEQVYKGLGEMQALATGVGDLKRVLTNVKTRGVWGEIQLGTLLEQLLTPQQYATNVATRPGSSERVEFAIRLPGRDGTHEVWLPIDAKFPLEDYQRIVDASAAADAVALEQAGKALEVRLRGEARDIRDKYVSPPDTTDFALLFLPTEGLYAEVLRRPGLVEALQREFRVVVSGPTTLAALLNSLQMGFRTLAIEERSSEVWQVLGAVKNEFGKFGDVLDKVHKKLEEASHVVEQAQTRSRAVGRKLRDVQETTPADAQLLLEPAAGEDTNSVDETTENGA